MSAQVTPLRGTRRSDACASVANDPMYRESHSVSFEDWSRVTTLAPEPTSSRAARHVVADWCIEQGIIGDVVDTLLLLTAELVTNAVLHGRSEVVLRLGRVGSRVRVGVGDENTRLPHRGDLDPDALTGRGMTLVEALADRHGVDLSPLGKTVWFDVLTGLAPVRAGRATA
ncbi:ATP-binding protein [Kineosporiaceae bacterium B12]|nr:ATP-binding protein [Kineococcus rubinsiae]